MTNEKLLETILRPFVEELGQIKEIDPHSIMKANQVRKVIRTINDAYEKALNTE